MKPCARRAVIGAAALVAGIVAILVVTHWGTVRDHVEAWHFQRTMATETIFPRSKGEASYSLATWKRFAQKKDRDFFWCAPRNLLFDLANLSGDPVVFDPAEGVHASELPADFYCLVFSKDVETLNCAGDAERILKYNGWCVIKQRFPRSVYIVRKDELFEEKRRTLFNPTAGAMPSEEGH